jgi:hypothetical protein
MIIKDEYMFNQHANRKTIIALLLSTTLVACGGGGGDSSDNSPPTTVTTYTVTATSSSGGTISPSSQTIQSGNTATLTVSPDSGFSIDTVEGCNGTLAENTYTIDNVTSDCSVDASFTAITYTVTATSGSGGTISPSSQTIQSGKTATLTVSPDSGFSIDTVEGCNGTLAENTYTIDNVTSDCSVDANFKSQDVINTLFVHFYFPEEGEDSVPYSISKTQSLVEGDDNSLISFFQSASYGQSLIVPSYMGLLDLGRSKSEFQSEDPLGQTLVSHALNVLEVNRELETYDMVVMMLPKLDFGYPGCQANKGVVSRSINGKEYNMRFAWLSGNDFSCYEKALMFHEVGHTYGTGHSSSIDCESLEHGTVVDLSDPMYCGSGVESTYYVTGDKFGIMGAYRGQPNIFWKIRAGWLQDSQIEMIDSSQDIVIDAFEIKSNGLKGIEIPLPEQQSTEVINYWAEYRVKPIVDNDSGNILRSTNQVQLRLNIPTMKDQFDQTQTDITLDFKEQLQNSDMILDEVGNFFHDPYRGVKVIWQGIESVGDLSKAIVKVEISEVTISSEEQGDIKTISLRNNSNSSININKVSLEGRSPDSFSIIDDQCAEVTVNANSSCTVKLKVLSLNGDKAAIIFDNSDSLRPLASLSLSN